MPLIHGHTIYIDSAWALTSISQRQFWPQFDRTTMGDGKVGGHAVGRHLRLGDAGRVRGQGQDRARMQQGGDRRGGLGQLKAALNNGSEVLEDENRARLVPRPDIVQPNPTEATNLEPLLVNTAGSWRHRPTAELPEVDNLFLASDYVQTYTDLATMEAANEAARRAVNAILEGQRVGCRAVRRVEAARAGRRAVPVAREADRVIYRIFGSSRGPLPAIDITESVLKRLRSLPTP